MNKTILVTACGKKKESKPNKAGILYKSTRIRFLYKRSKELGIPFYILSAKYGLINAEEIIAPYEMTMDENRCKNIFYYVVKKLFEMKPKKVLFYKGGSPAIYYYCIEKACNLLDIKIKAFGYANMGDINKLEELKNEKT